MTVYVDNWQQRAKVGQLDAVWSHLMVRPGGDLAELHRFAKAIGLRREWFQNPPKHRHPHYDVTQKKRQQAIEAGAVAITWQEAGRMRAAVREVSRQPDPGPFRWFWAGRVRKPCPECGHLTSVGFDRADPGVSDREPTRCVQCTTAEIDNAVQLSRGELGYPLTEQGPCASCGAPTRLYGPQGSPRCEACVRAEPAPGPSAAPEPSVTGQPQPCPLASEARPEPDLELSA